MAQPRCLYCGGALSPAAQQNASAAAHAALASGAPALQQRPERGFVVFDATGVGAPVLAGALGLTSYEAGQRLRRGGVQLHRVLALREAEAEAARLAALGVRALAIPEAETRAADTPLLALGGTAEGDVLQLRLAAARLSLGAKDVGLIVRGPIVREYQTRAAVRKTIRTATLEAGYRFHLHCREDPAPIEIDPWAFELGRGASGSSFLTLAGWIDGLGASAPRDDAFRFLPPALAPEATLVAGALNAGEALLRKRPSGRNQAAPVILDNLRQFRAYSGWRGAFERRRRG